MLEKNRFKLIVAAALLLSSASFVCRADGAYSNYTPYSIFGVGDMSTPGSAYNRTMGGVGIASRNNRYLNFLNPAAVTARDSLAFMSDYSFYENNKVLKQGDYKSANNTFNINDIAISFPITRNSAMILGLRPYSSTGYSFGYYETNPLVVATTDNMSHSYTGNGSIYQFFAGAGVTVFKRLSLGAEYIHYFGDIEKSYAQTFGDAAALSVTHNSSIQLSGNTAKFGAQLELPIGTKYKIGLGATYMLDSKLNGYLTNTTLNGEMTMFSSADTLGKTSDHISLSNELGFGLSFNYMDKFRAEVDYILSDWTGCGFEQADGFSVNKTGGVPMFTGTRSQTIRVGVEYIPNMNDIRYYFKKVAYRAGAFWRSEYYQVNGNPIVTKGLTFGMTLPVFRWYNGLTLGMELGRRGSTVDNLVLENYCCFSIGVNLFDIWFQRPHYE